MRPASGLSSTTKVVEALRRDERRHTKRVQLRDKANAAAKSDALLSSENLSSENLSDGEAGSPAKSHAVLSSGGYSDGEDDQRLSENSGYPRFQAPIGEAARRRSLWVECTTRHDLELKRQDEEEAAQAAKMLSAGKGLARFRGAVRRVMDDMEKQSHNRVSVKAVAIRAKRRFLTGFKQLENDEERQFVSSVLRSLPLMLKETVWLRDVWKAAVQLRDTADPAGLMASMSQVLHKLKLVTARLCWSTHIQVEREQRKIVEEHHSGLKEQFRKVREQYLHEVATLRDRLRARTDPERFISSAADITLFYDPASSLTEEEMGFVSKVVKEKLKMIFEQAPEMKGSCNLDQLASMEKQVEATEVRDLKAALARQVKSNAELQDKVRDLQAAVTEDQRKTASKFMASGAEGMVTALEAKVEQLRNQLKEQGEDQSAYEAEALREEQQQLRQALEEEASDRKALQQQLDDLAARAEEAEVARYSAEDEKAKVLARSEQADAEIEELQGEVERLRTALEAATANDDGALEGAGDAEHEDASASAGGRRRRGAGMEEDGEKSTEAKAPRRWPVVRKRMVEPTTVDFGSADLGDPRTVVSVLKGESTAKKMSRRCTELEAEVEQLRNRCEGLQMELGATRQENAKRRMDEAMEETARFREMSEAMDLLSDDADPELVAARDVAQKSADLDKLRAEAAQLAEQFKTCKAHASSGNPEDLRHLHEMQISARQQEFSIFMAEIQLETAKWAQDAAGASAQQGSPQSLSSRALLQKIAAHCQKLTRKVEDSTAMSLHLSQAVGDLQNETLATVTKLRASDAVQQDPSLREHIDRLETAGFRDIFRQASDSGKEKVFQRLFRKVISEAWENRRQQHAQETLDRWLPAIKLAKELEQKAPEVDNVRRAPPLITQTVALQKRSKALRGAHPTPDVESTPTSRDPSPTPTPSLADAPDMQLNLRGAGRFMGPIPPLRARPSVDVPSSAPGTGGRAGPTADVHFGRPDPTSKPQGKLRRSSLIEARRASVPAAVSGPPLPLVVGGDPPVESRGADRAVPVVPGGPPQPMKPTRRSSHPDTNAGKWRMVKKPEEEEPLAAMVAKPSTSSQPDARVVARHLLDAPGWTRMVTD